MAELLLASTRGRGTIAATVLGSGIAFLDSIIVTVALPAIAEEFDAGFDTVQWVTSAYLLTLGSLVLVGGALGDRFGRRRLFVLGLLVFLVASLACGLAPSAGALVVARAAQGVGAAMLTPNSLGMLQAVYVPEDRGRAIGLWSGMSGVSTAVGPFVGGWLVDAVDWRLIFLINVPLVVAAIALALRYVPETRDPTADPRVDVLGGVLVTLGLGALVAPWIETDLGWPARLLLTAGGCAALVGFWVRERRIAYAMVPPSLFLGSRAFTVLNLYTFGVYGALTVGLFLLTVHLQADLGWSALQAGIASLPVTLLLLLLSPRTGAVAARTGPRALLVGGAVLVAVGLALLAGVSEGDGYVSAVLPGVLVFGLGLALLVAPLTTAVLGAAGADRAGVASGINNAVARLAGLVTVAVVPAVAGIGAAAGEGLGGGLSAGYATAMLVTAALSLVSAGVAAVALGR